MLPGVLDHLDGIEVICGGMPGNLNQLAIRYAQEHPIPRTGGSDAHILADVGSVITGAPADTVEEFLTSIRRRENVVVGRPAGCMHKGATAGVIAWSFVPYTVSRLCAHYAVHKRRIPGILSRFTGKLPPLRDLQKEERKESEERGEDPGD